MHYRNRYKSLLALPWWFFLLCHSSFIREQLSDDWVYVEKKITLEVICSFKEQRKNNVSKGKEIAIYSGSKQRQATVLGGTTCWYRWRRAFSHENYTILAACFREPGWGEVFSFWNFHYTVLTCSPRLPGHVNSSEFYESIRTESTEKKENS